MIDKHIINKIAKYNRPNISNDLLTKIHKVLLIALFMIKTLKNSPIHTKDSMRTIIIISHHQIYTKMNNLQTPNYLKINSNSNINPKIKTFSERLDQVLNLEILLNPRK